MPAKSQKKIVQFSQTRGGLKACGCETQTQYLDEGKVIFHGCLGVRDQMNDTLCASLQLGFYRLVRYTGDVLTAVVTFLEKNPRPLSSVSI